MTDNPLFLCCVALSLLKLCFVGKTAATRKEKKKTNHVEEHVIEALNKTTAAIVGNIPIYCKLKAVVCSPIILKLCFKIRLKQFWAVQELLRISSC